MSLKQNNYQPRREGLCNSIKEMKENLNIYNGSDVTLLKVKTFKFISTLLYNKKKTTKVKMSNLAHYSIHKSRSIKTDHISIYMHITHIFTRRHKAMTTSCPSNYTNEF